MKDVMILSVVLLVSSVWAGTYSGGNGQAGTPYQISTVQDWQELIDTHVDWDKHFILTQDINFGGATLTPVGTSSNRFTGVFDGNSHALSHFVINQPSASNVGLFGYIGSGGMVRELGADSFDISGGWSTGGLVGYNWNGTIRNSYAVGSVNGSSNNIGGLVGYQSGSSSIIENCYSGVTVTGSWSSGGLVGYNSSGTIIACYSTGSVSGSGNVGGLVGNNWNGTVSACYSTASVSGSSSVGGLVGSSSGPILSSFWDRETSGQPGSAGGKGLTTEQMMTMSIFQNAGWYDLGWTIDNGIDSPRLAWENAPGVPIPEAPPTPLIGDGSVLTPYEIHTAQDFELLSWYADVLDKHIVLMSDLDLQDVEIYPIGELGPFVGVFDGQGYILENALIEMPSGYFVGLFGYVGSGGNIINLGLNNVSVSGKQYVGGLVGYQSGSSSIIACYSIGVVNGSTSVGGLVGYSSSGAIASCYTKGSVNGSSSNVGGLVGFLSSGGTITACYSTALVSGSSQTGGLVGSSSVPISSSFWDRETSGQSGSAGGKGLTTEQMMTMSIFQNADWYDLGWTIDNGIDTPRLEWENALGVPIPEGLSAPLIGDGTESEPYEIHTVEEFALLSWYTDILDKQIVLMADLDLHGVEIYPIGDLKPFTGVFDGQGHTLNNVDMEMPSGSFIGVFGLVGSGGQIKRLGVNDGLISGRHFIGGLAGRLSDSSSSVENCYFEGVVSGTSSVGGLIGSSAGSIIDSYSIITVTGQNAVGGLCGSSSGAIINSHASGSVYGPGAEDRDIGGLCGINNGSVTLSYANAEVSGQEGIGGLIGRNDGVVEESYATGDIIGQYQYHYYESGLGGLIGSNFGIVRRCYAIGDVSGSRNLGGLVGYTGYNGSISNSFATGNVDGNERIGGLIGFQQGGELVNCYSTGYIIDYGYGWGVGGLVGDGYSYYTIACFWDVNTSGRTWSAAGQGKTTAEMQTLSTFTDEGWNFAHTWWMPVDYYPKLQWGMNEIVIGTGSDAWEYPLSTYYQDARTQTIYLASEIGRACTILSLSLEVAQIPGQTMNHFTIRLKYTDHAVYSSSPKPVWESEGWTTVYQSDEAITKTGWVQFDLETPFIYNGTQNLMVDISFSNIFWTSDGYCRYSSPGGMRTLYYRTDGDFGNPLNWSATTPTPNATANVPNIRLHVCNDEELTPDLTGDGFVGIEDFALFASQWLMDDCVSCCWCEGADFDKSGDVGLTDLWEFVMHWLTGERDSIVWVPINAPGFTGEVSKYETTNAQFAQYLNDALASGDIEITGHYVIGANGSNPGEDYVGDPYYHLNGPGWSGAGATNGGASRINYSSGTFTVDSGFENHPVTYVSWYGATAFASYYSWRLPTENEWESLASYTDGRYYATGNSLYDSQKFLANYLSNGDNSFAPNNLPYHPWVEHGTSEVGYFGTFGYGLADMSGNVWEWTSSVIYGSSRVLRGGSWLNHDDACSVSSRHLSHPHVMYHVLGFRVCR